MQHAVKKMGFVLLASLLLVVSASAQSTAPSQTDTSDVDKKTIPTPSLREQSSEILQAGVKDSSAANRVFRDSRAFFIARRI